MKTTAEGTTFDLINDHLEQNQQVWQNLRVLLRHPNKFTVVEEHLCEDPVENKLTVLTSQRLMGLGVDLLLDENQEPLVIRINHTGGHIHVVEYDPFNLGLIPQFTFNGRQVTITYWTGEDCHPVTVILALEEED